MNVHTMPPGPARAVRARKSSRPRSVRPRFKQPAQAAPEADPAALRRLRLEAEAAVERLLSLLDGLDADADLEPAGDEQDASYPEGGGRVCEPNEDAELSGDENEPSLGSANPTIWGNGGIWSSPTINPDFEDDHDGREPDHDQEDDRADCEPPLGWTTGGVIGNTSVDDVDVEGTSGEAVLA